MRLVLATNKKGWAGWCGNLYSVQGKATQAEIDTALQQMAKRNASGAAIIGEYNSLYGWGYTDKRYKDGPYFWPFFIESDTYIATGKNYVETRSVTPDI